MFNKEFCWDDYISQIQMMAINVPKRAFNQHLNSVENL
jgi:hypothetical protein